LTEDLSDVAVISERRMTGVAGVSSKWCILIVLGKMQVSKSGSWTCFVRTKVGRTVLIRDGYLLNRDKKFQLRM
jgi:hypothetical protein